MILSSSRFNKCITSELNVQMCSSVEFGGFMHAVYEHAFSINRRERGIIERITLGSLVETEPGVFDRFARVDVKNIRDNIRKYFYVFAEKYANSAEEWSVTARSVQMGGPIRMPDYTQEIMFVP